MTRYGSSTPLREARDSTPTEASLFARAILGRPVPDPRRAAWQAQTERDELERLAPFVPRCAERLRELDRAEALARQSRESLTWAAGISNTAEATLRGLLREEAAAAEAQRRWERHFESQWTAISEQRPWREEDHPRAAAGTPEGGRFVEKGAGGGGSSAKRAGGRGERTKKREAGGGERITKRADGWGRGGRGDGAGIPPRMGARVLAVSAKGDALNSANPSHWYVPSDAKGAWLGEKGDSTFRLKTPVDVNGKLIHDIEFKKGVPVLDKFTLPGNTATIILTGDHGVDQRRAEAAWRKLNPGMKLPDSATFHHDLLNVAEEVVTIEGKKTKVLVGKMRLVPTKVHETVFHQGSASVARRFYEGIGLDWKSVKTFVDEGSDAASNAVARGAKNIKPGKIAKGIKALVGRSIARAIPFVGTGLVLLEFTANVEAHGLGGAMLRATPVLGDLIAVHDLASDLAKQIEDEANAAASEYTRELNESVRKAWEEADEQMLAAFQELAPQIDVTNKREGGYRPLVDPAEIAAVLESFRNQMFQANYARLSKGFDFDAAAKRNFRQLRRRLERASQKNAPRSAPWAPIT